MKIKAIITGSTGMIGKGVLLECLESDQVESVLVINRSSCKIQHNKLSEILLDDFFNIDSLGGKLSGYNACFFCLGITSVGVSEQDYFKTTFELTLKFAEAVLAVNPDMTFCYVSGGGTDSTEKGRISWARVKGKTENALLAMSFKSAYMFRPNLVVPKKGIQSRTRIYNLTYIFLKPFLFMLMPFKGMITTSEILGKAMIAVVLQGYNVRVLESSDINKLGRAV
jgi:hypothetical protein